MGGKVGIVAHQQDIGEIVFRVSVDAVDVILDTAVVVATHFGEAHHGGGTARQVLPVDERLHGFHVLVGADDKHLTGIGQKWVFGSLGFVIDEAMAV